MKSKILFLFLFLSSVSSAQNIDSLYLRSQIDSLTGESFTTYNEGKYAQSATLRLEAIPFIKELKNWKEVVTEYNYVYFTAFAGDNAIQSEDALDSAMHYAQKYLTDADIEMHSSKSNLGYNAYSNADYPKAIEYYEEAIAGYKRINSPFENYYNNVLTLLTCYRQKGDMEYGLQSVESYLPLTDSVPKAYDYMKSDLLNYKAIFQRENEQWNDALQTLSTASAHNATVSDQGYKDFIEFELLQSTAYTYKRQKNYPKALSYFKRANAHKLKTNNALDYFNYTDLGDLYLDQENYVDAIQNYSQALKIYARKNISNNKIRALYQSSLGYCYLKSGQIDSATVYMQKAKENLGIPLDAKLETIDDYNESAAFNLQSIKVLSWLAELENQLAYNAENPVHKTRALARYGQAFNGSKYLQRELMSKSSKYLLNKNIQEHFTNYVQLLIAQYQDSGTEDDFTNIFHAIEDNKSILIKEDIHEKTVLAQSKIPENLLQEEEDLQVAINDLKKNVHKHKLQEGQEESIIQDWKNQITELDREYASFQKSLERDYPEYHKRKYTLSKADLTALQTQLDSDAVYLNYFNTEQDIYCARISNNETSVFKVASKKELSQKVEELLAIIRKENKNLEQKEELIKYKELAHELFIKLIPDDTKSATKLIVSPSGILHYLPYEALIVSENENQKSFGELDYLIKSKVIEYAFSSDLWLESKTKAENDTDMSVASFAPFIGESEKQASRNCSRDMNMSGLPCSVDEVNAISNYFENQSKLGENATLKEFNSSNSKSILHLATHACLDNEDPSFNKLLFFDQDLSLLELESMDLEAGLAILSACNTASGKLESGEGVINLSKGFRKAGVKSMISSLWSINDCSTAEIIQNFYKELKSSGKISSSLQNAKLQYIENADKRHTHPYFWAGLVFSGDSEVFKAKIAGFDRANYLYFAVLFLALLLFFYFRRK